MLAMAVNSIPPLIQSALQHKLPPKIDYGIAFIGCGGIVNYGHIPSYKTHGFNMIGCYDINPEAARKTVQEHGLRKIYPTLDDVFNDPLIQIVDIATMAWDRRAIVETVSAAGKHMLCQKPLSDKYVEAVEMTDIAQRANLKIAVQQQFRWSSLIRSVQALLVEGWVGEVLDAEIQVSIHTPWDMWPWIASQPRLEVLYHSIHYLDSLRFLFGDPALVTSRHTKHPAQQARGETKTITVWDYPNGLQILIVAGVVFAASCAGYRGRDRRDDWHQLRLSSWPHRHIEVYEPIKPGTEFFCHPAGEMDPRRVLRPDGISDGSHPN